MTPVLMPQVGENLTTGVIVEWFKKEMEPVAKGDALLAVESEKAVFEVVAEDGGVLLKILQEAGSEVGVLKPVAFIGQPHEVQEIDAVAPDAQRVETTQTSPLPAHVAAPAAAGRNDDRRRDPVVAAGPAVVRTGSQRVFSSPSARRLARERHVDLGNVRGTGPNQRIIKRDVLRAAGTGKLSEAPGLPDVVPFNRMRRHIAERMSLSAGTKPHFYLFVDVDMTAAQEMRCPEGELAAVSITDLLIRATARGLRRFERLNAYVSDEGTAPKPHVHIGVATTVAESLLVPVISDADGRSLNQISRARRDAVVAAARGVLRRSSAATFTIANLGMHGVSGFLPLINPPECAILAAGAVEQRVAVHVGEVTVRELMTLTLACDHRAVDGDYAARFLQHIRTDLETPDGLL